MLARIVFLLLLALNIAAALWLWLAPVPERQRLATADPGVAVLTLLGESLASLGDASAELADAPEPMPEPLPVQAGSAASSGASLCIEIGPFQTQSALRQAETALVALGQPLASRETVERSFRGYWVYLPAFASRDRALVTARELAAAGVRDYYVVTAGDRENTISLGLFRDRANAERRQGEMRSRGYPAELSERVEEQRVFWLAIRQPDPAPIDWRTLVGTGQDLGASEVACATVERS
ncbi:MAG: SPOR domain-containing protein [Xanthomonadales bacterium]|nr:SPOR domain-containing protein [Xanthomonadales bacterium]